MKKRTLSIILGISVIFLITISFNLISASYSCTDGTDIIEDIDEVDIGKRQKINEIGRASCRERV